MKLSKIHEKDGIAIYAKESCTKCYGRGWVGTMANTGEKIACRCLKILREVVADKPIEEKPFTPFAPLTAKAGEEYK